MKILILICLSLTSLTHAVGQAAVHVETDLITTGYNDVRIPGDDGALFSPDGGAAMYYRIRASYTMGSRHTVSVLFAPLTVNYDNDYNRNIEFAGETFPANSAVRTEYKFNSYRLTYRYGLIRSANFDLGIGLTAKIRDAKIALSSGNAQAEKTNVGFVPLINFNLLWRFHEKMGLVLEGDALAAPQGRAEDALLAFLYRLSGSASLHAGYRILEGGADNDEVYNFSLFHYASIGFRYQFNDDR